MVYYGDLDQRSQEDPTVIRRYQINVSQHYIDGYQFTDEEKIILRPIAETIALIAGASDYHLVENLYEHYLPEAASLYFDTGEPKHLSWILDRIHESASVEEAWKNWKSLKSLSNSE